jgi:hypothetical protein
LTGRHRTALRTLEKPRTLAVLAFAAVLLAGTLAKVGVDELSGPGGQPAVAAPPLPVASPPVGTPPVDSAPAAVSTGSPSELSRPPSRPATKPPASPSPEALARPSPSATGTPKSPQQPPSVYEAESQANTLAGGAAPATCWPCSGGRVVRWVGYGGTLQFNGLVRSAAGPASVTFWYVNGDAPRNALLSVNGGGPIWLTFPSTGGWTSLGSVTVSVPLVSGANRLKVSNTWAWAPDFDKISVW